MSQLTDEERRAGRTAVALIAGMAAEDRATTNAIADEVPADGWFDVAACTAGMLIVQALRCDAFRCVPEGTTLAESLQMWERSLA